MDTIALARELGKSIQQEESYIKLHTAQTKADNDAELQQLIGEFNLKRMNINNEASKEDKAEDKLQLLNQEMRHAYAQIMKNENMSAYTAAKSEFDTVMQRVLAIVSQSAEGEDPETTDFSPSCSGSCSSCSGCH